MGLLDGKIGVIYGVANQRSIAWGIAQAAAREGATSVITYQNERFESSVNTLAEGIPNASAMQCDVESDDDIARVYSNIERDHGRLDFVVHSVAFAPREDLTGRFIDTSRQGFATALSISAYSLLAVSRPAIPLMSDGSSIITLTFSSQRVFPGYNIMGAAKSALESIVRYMAVDLGPQGIRVNAVSAGPTETTAARGIPGFMAMRSVARERAPLGRNTNISEIGDASIFLLSDLSRAITGEVMFVDCGLNVMGG